MIQFPYCRNFPIIVGSGIREFTAILDRCRVSDESTRIMGQRLESSPCARMQSPALVSLYPQPFIHRLGLGERHALQVL